MGKFYFQDGDRAECSIGSAVNLTEKYGIIWEFPRNLIKNTTIGEWLNIKWFKKDPQHLFCKKLFAADFNKLSNSIIISLKISKRGLIYVHAGFVRSLQNSNHYNPANSCHKFKTAKGSTWKHVHY